MVVAVTALHGFARWVTPLDSLHPETPVWLSVLLFQAVLIAAIWLGSLFIPNRPQLNGLDFSTALEQIPLGMLLVISALGLVLHLVGKAWLLHAILSDCPTELRSIWMSHDRSLDPVWMRASSMLGYLGAHFAMPGLLICSWRIARSPQARGTWFSFGVFAVVILIFAGVIVSRMVILTALVIVGLGVLLAVFDTKGLAPKYLLRGTLPVLVFLALAVFFNHQVFKTKIECGTNSSGRYVSTNLDGTDVVVREAWSEGRLATSIYPTLHYLNHAVWNYAMVMNSERRGAPVLMAFAHAYLHRIGLKLNSSEAGPRVHSRGGVTLPGAAYHDFGYLGLMAVAVFTAALWIVGAYLLMLGGARGLFGLAMIVAAGLNIALSLLFVAPATISYPFTVFAFLACAIIRWICSLVRSRHVGDQTISKCH